MQITDASESCLIFRKAMVQTMNKNMQGASGPARSWKYLYHHVTVENKCTTLITYINVIFFFFVNLV